MSKNGVTTPTLLIELGLMSHELCPHVLEVVQYCNTHWLCRLTRQGLGGRTLPEIGIAIVSLLVLLPKCHMASSFYLWQHSPSHLLPPPLSSVQGHQQPLVGSGNNGQQLLFNPPTNMGASHLLSPTADGGNTPLLFLPSSLLPFLFHTSFLSDANAPDEILDLGVEPHIMTLLV